MREEWVFFRWSTELEVGEEAEIEKVSSLRGLMWRKASVLIIYKG
jgi:hypothetical protein